jgi:hypothetical protein
VLSKETPLESARKFAQYQANNNDSHLCYFRGGLYQWTGTHYTAADPEEVRTELFEWLDTKAAQRDKKSHALMPFNPRPANVEEIME